MIEITLDDINGFELQPGDILQVAENGDYKLYKDDRIWRLESLIVDLYTSAVDFNFPGWQEYFAQIFEELGIEV